MSAISPIKPERYRNHAFTHGFSVHSNRHPIYQAWADMKKRCLNPNHKSYTDYGGRGILIQLSWIRFEGFLKDMGSSWVRGLTLERVDNSLTYCKENCVWASRKAQANNRRTNVVLVFNGYQLTMKEWALKIGINYQALSYRIRAGWKVSEALTLPVRHK
jgi:hypothetical protein